MVSYITEILQKVIGGLRMTENKIIEFDINQPFVTQEQKFKYWQESKQCIKDLLQYIKQLESNKMVDNTK